MLRVKQQLGQPGGFNAELNRLSEKVVTPGYSLLLRRATVIS